MNKGWQTIEGNDYYYGVSGNKVTGWMTMSGDKYYFDSEGILVKDQVVTIDGNDYEFGWNGVLTHVTVNNPETISDAFTNEVDNEVNDYGNDDLECNIEKIVIYQDETFLEEAVKKSDELNVPMISFKAFKTSGIIPGEVVWIGNDEV